MEKEEEYNKKLPNVFLTECRGSDVLQWFVLNMKTCVCGHGGDTQEMTENKMLSLANCSTAVNKTLT